MALIKCPECGKEISDMSEVCIHCGYPVKEMSKKNQAEDGPETYEIQVLNYIPLAALAKSSYTAAEKEKASKSLKAEEWLLNELLGFSKEESRDIAAANRTYIAKNINGDQACIICGAFEAYGVDYGLNGLSPEERINIHLDTLKEYTDGCIEKKDHYCDEPIISAEQRTGTKYTRSWEQEKYVESMQRKKEEEKANVPKCPTCGSMNIQKISTAGRVASTSILGLASRKINKTFKCNNCGYTW